MTIAIPSHAFAEARWRRHLVVLAAVSAAILLLFRRDVAQLVATWWTSSNFGHCLLIGPVIGWLVWQRRADLARLEPAAWAPGLGLVAIGGMGWLLGDAGSVTFARQFGLVVMLQGCVVTLLGPSVGRGLLFPTGYALFLVPFGDWLEAPLQQITVAIVMPLLTLVGVPAVSNGVLIHAGPYYFEVAEACSGVKFVLAMLAIGVLVAHVGFASWRRRAVLMAAVLVVPVLANGLRAFLTIWVACLTSIDSVVGIDHLLWGWALFAGVVTGVLAVAWRWFDRAPDAPAFDPAALRMRVPRFDLIAAALLVCTVAAVFPTWSNAVANRATPLGGQAALPDVPGWRRIAPSDRARWQPHHPGADRFLVGRYADAHGVVDVAVAVYARQDEGRELAAFGTGVLRPDDGWVRIRDEAPVAGGSAMRITAPGPVERTVATWYRVGGVTTADERRVKIETARTRMLGGDQRAAAIHLSAVVEPGRDAEASIRRFLVSVGRVERLAGD